MKEVNYLVLFVIAAFFMTGCADTVDVSQYVSEDPYGFFYGIWHGLIAIFSFIGSLFSDEIAVYAVNNTGGWYDLGFLIGVGSAIGSGSKVTITRKR